MYESLSQFGYKFPKDIANEVEKRLDSPATVKLGLTIKPFSQQKQVRLSNDFQLFYITTPELLKLIEKIMQNSKQIELESSDMEDNMLTYLKRTQLINEIKSTNDIEGVRSTKKEIDDAILAQDSSEMVRFKRTVSMYMKSLNAEKLTIENLEDFRHIYDEVVAEEVEDDEQPDGLLFRADSVKILDQRNNKVVHRGIPSESLIHEDLLKLIAFMNQDEHAYIIKAIVTHYFFEYIHPFYDGNGRMGRFILTSYLMNKLDVFSGLSLSESIFIHRKKYEDTFIDTSSPRNYGDLTPFILTMLKTIESGQKKILNEIQLINFRRDNVEDYIYSSDFTEVQGEVLLILLQRYLFELPNQEIETRELDELMKGEYSRRRINDALSELEEQGFVIKVKSRPTTYILNEDAIPDFG